MVISTCIKLKTVDQRLTIVQQPILSSGDVGTVRVEYELDSYWEGFAPSGTFYTAENPKDVYEQILVDGACVIPWEALQNDGILFIGLRGVNASGLIKTAAPIRYRVERGSPRGSGTSVAPTPDVYMQLLTVLAGGNIPVDKFLEIVQTTGNSETAVMSQKAVTDALAEKGGGLTAAQISALDGLLKIAAYTADASDAYAAFKAAFADNGGGEVEPDVPEGHVHAYNYSTTTAPTCTETGIRTYVCSCGHSYTSTLPATGHSYVDGVCSVCGSVDHNYIDPSKTEPVYELAEATTFNADHVVDTGYKLLDVDKSWSVCADFTDAARGGTVWDASPNASQGLALSHRGEYFRELILAGSLYKDIGTAVGNYKVIVTHAKNTGLIEYHFIEPSKAELQYGEITYTKYLTDTNIINSNPHTVKVGGNYNGSAATYKGTVNRFKIYERVLTVDEINAFMEVSA